MRKNFGAKPWMYPMPVLILASYDEKGMPDAMNAAWSGISEESEISICVDEGHKTMANIIERGAFTVSFATEDTVLPCDYVGIVSAKDVPDKFKRAGFHPLESSFVDAPLIAELPMALECRMKSYDEKNCRLVGEIINVCVDKDYLDEAGKPSVGLIRPIVYEPVCHSYYALGKKVGQAFCDGLMLKQKEEK